MNSSERDYSSRIIVNKLKFLIGLVSLAIMLKAIWGQRESSASAEFFNKMII